MFGIQSGFSQYKSIGDFSSFYHTYPVANTELHRLKAQDSSFLFLWHGYDCHSPYLKPPFAEKLFSPNYSGPFLELARQPLTYERIRHSTYFEEFYPEVIVSEGREFVDISVFEQLENSALNSTKLTQEDIDFLTGTYAGAVLYMDWYFGQMLHTLQELDLLDSSIIIVLSDHGEDLMENGYFNHRHSLHDSNTHVPVMVKAPNLKPTVMDHPIGLKDLRATIDFLLDRQSTKSTWFDTTPSIILSESITGQISSTNGQVRLLVQRSDYTTSFPEEPPSTVEVVHHNEQSVPWNSPVIKDLWESLSPFTREQQ